MFDFSKTEAAKSSTFLKPGVYRLKPTKVTLGAFPKGTKYLEVTFETEDEVEFSEKFSLTDKAIGRLQYLHEAFFAKKCEKAFKSEDEVAAYFKKALTTKSIVKNVILGGEISGNNVYASLPYTNFVDTDEALDLGEFEEDGEEWKKYVKKRTTNTSEVAGKDNGILNDDDDDADPIGAGKSKKGTTAASKKDPKGATKKNAKKDESEEGSEEDDDDMPW
jgi:adenylate cyclase class IV